jgi:hypothetical protein
MIRKMKAVARHTMPLRRRADLTHYYPHKLPQKITTKNHLPPWWTIQEPVFDM